MFLQNLLKKLGEIFTLDNLKSLLINNFRDVVILISSAGLFIIIFVLFVMAITNRKTVHNKPVQVTNVIETAIVNSQIKDFLISPDDIILPKIDNFDLTDDYVEFMPSEKFKGPSIDLITRSSEKILDDSINDSLKFNFEKRSSYSGK